MNTVIFWLKLILSFPKVIIYYTANVIWELLLLAGVFMLHIFSDKQHIPFGKRKKALR